MQRRQVAEQQRGSDGIAAAGIGRSGYGGHGVAGGIEPCERLVGEVEDAAGRLAAAGLVPRVQDATTCCYAQSDKAWVNDPNGLRWETFYSFGEATSYGEDEPDAVLREATKPAAACC